jgi:hypothetical protein
MSEESSRSRVYNMLRELGMTHHQAKHLIITHLSDMGEWKNVLYRNLQKERKQWEKPAELIAAMSMREDPKQAGNSIYNQCWGEADQPEAPFVCASIAAQIVADAYELKASDKRILWKPIERILAYEKRTAELAWVDRMIPTYLRIRRGL